MAKAAYGFVFSLDAFVAFSLIIIAIQTIVIASSIPSGYYPALLQAQFLAKDTLNAISTTKISDNWQTALAQASRKIANGQPLQPSDAIIEISNKIIAPPYSYAYSFYDLKQKKWIVVYNASNLSYTTSDDPRINITFKRVAASSQMFVFEYSIDPVRPESPYCNVMCKGWVGNPPDYTPPAACTKTPCDPQSASLYQTGDIAFGLLRLTVWG
jgi:hypothetical protein